MKWIDSVVDRITMYRLALYELIFLLIVAESLSYFGQLPFLPQFLALSIVYLLAVSWVVNKAFAWAFRAPSNPESLYITALILALIIAPPSSYVDARFLILAGWAAALSTGSKYILAIGKKHLFNPAAFGVAATSLALGLGASWWVGTGVMLPFVIVGGFLVIHKMRRLDLFWAFFIVALISIMARAVSVGGNVLASLNSGLVTAPLIFFASVMLTEPFTTPPSKLLRITYGGLVGFLFAPFVHLGSIYSTPELALLVGNAFSYLVSPKRKLILTLKGRARLTRDTFDLVFTSEKPLLFKPGQYLEWTLAHAWPDTRGIRRFFTIASSPTEHELRLGVKFYQNGSTFKKRLLTMKPGDTIIASQLGGNFVLPKDIKKKLVFIAGGIGITPFRSQIQYLLDTQEVRPITLFYANKTPADVAYHQMLALAKEKLGIKTVYAFTDPGAVPQELPSAVPAITAGVIKREVPDFAECTFYLSGPHGMVTAFEEILADMDIPKRHIKTDFFPGFV
jgi:ferredoxin-NADP reductase